MLLTMSWWSSLASVRIYLDDGMFSQPLLLAWDGTCSRDDTGFWVSLLLPIYTDPLLLLYLIICVSNLYILKSGL